MTWITAFTIVTALYQDPQPAERGPIHEAFAQPVEARSTRGPILTKEPPAPVTEQPPDEKPEGDNVLWIDGYWHFDPDRDDFIWISGFWRQTPPGQVWMPGRFEKDGDGRRWYSGYWQVEEQANQEPEQEQPPPSLDVGPTIPAPQPNMTWAPGFYVRQERRWAWRTGTWITYRPGWVWSPARWIYTPSGFVFTSGYWDYPLEYRGVIYAPVYYPRGWIARPGYFYRPSVIIVNNDLSCGLFNRPGAGIYYFGNYFSPVYGNQGYVFWANQRPIYRPDPLFVYYRQSRDRAWVAGVQDFGRLRQEGKPAVAPPLALVSANGPKPPLARVSGDSVRVVSANQQGKVNLKNPDKIPPKTDIPPSQVVARPIRPVGPGGRPIVSPNNKDLAKDSKGNIKDIGKSKDAMINKDKGIAKDLAKSKDMPPTKDKGLVKDIAKSKDTPPNKDKMPQKDLPAINPTKDKGPAKDLAKPKDIPLNKDKMPQKNLPVVNPTKDKGPMKDIGSPKDTPLKTPQKELPVINPTKDKGPAKTNPTVPPRDNPKTNPGVPSTRPPATVPPSSTKDTKRPENPKAPAPSGNGPSGTRPSFYSPTAPTTSTGTRPPASLGTSNPSSRPPVSSGKSSSSTRPPATSGSGSTKTTSPSTTKKP